MTEQNINNFIKEYDYESIKEFLVDISYGGRLDKELDGVFAFRGHSRSDYELIPSVLRTDTPLMGIFNLGENEDSFYQVYIEYILLGVFLNEINSQGLFIREAERLWKSLCTNNFEYGWFFYREWIPEELYDLASLAQHYGLPTRLLDWSDDINIALYFALSENIGKEKRAEKFAIWALNTEIINGKIKQRYKKYDLLPFYKDLPLKIIRPLYNNNPNLTAQQGLFTLWQIKGNPIKVEKQKAYIYEGKVDRTPLDRLVIDYLGAREDYKASSPVMYKFVVELDDMNEGLKFLESNKCSASYVFPGYYGAARYCQHYLEKNKTILYNNKAAFGKTIDKLKSGK